MIQMRSILVVTDNSGPKRIGCIRVLGKKNKRYAEIGDIIVASVKESLGSSEIKKGQVVQAVLVRTKNPISRPDGTFVKFDDNAAVIINKQKEPIGTRVFGPVARELREKTFTKIISLAPEVI